MLLETGSVSAVGERENKEFLLMDAGVNDAIDSLKNYLTKIVGEPTRKKELQSHLSLYFSHMHYDHVENYVWLFRNYTIDKVYLPQIKYKTTGKTETDKANKFLDKITTSAAAVGAQVISMKYNTKNPVNSPKKYKFGKNENFDLLILGAINSSSYNKGKPNSAVNNWSLVTMVDFNKFKYLSAGDIETASETKLVGKYGNKKNKKKMLRADVMKLSHHGIQHDIGSISNTEEFLKEVRPKYTFVQTRYGLGHLQYEDCC